MPVLLMLTGRTNRIGT